MLTRPNDSEDRGRGLVAMTYPPSPLVDGDSNTPSGVLSSAPVWSSSSSFPSVASITTSTYPPPISSTPPSTVSFSSPPSSVDCPPLSLSTDSSSITLFPCHHLKHNSISAVSSSPGLLPSGSSSTPLITSSTHSSISSPYVSHVLPLFSPVPPSCSTQCPYPLPSQLLSSSPNVSPFPSDSPLSSAQSTVHYRHSTLVSLTSPPPAVSTPCASHTAATVYPPCSSPTTSVSSSVLYSPVSLPHTTSILPPVSPSCCPCSTLLPRLLSAHRLEVRRLLRGALATLSRRLDSLERRSRRNVRKKRSRQVGEGESAPCSHVSATSPLSPSLTVQEQGESNRKRRKIQRDINHSFKNGKEDKEVVEDEGRFVVQMAVSVVREEEGEPLVLHNLINRRRADSGSSQPEKAVAVFRPNGFRTPVLLHSISTSSSQSSMHLLHSVPSNKSETLELSSGQWRFSNILFPFSFSSCHRAFRQWFSSSSLSDMKPTLQLKLSAVTAEMILESMRRGACGSPLRPLKDWTAPPSLSTDHCSPSDVVREQSQQNHHRLHLPQRRPLPLSSCSTIGPSAGLPNGQRLPGAVVETNKERGKRVSQIRIRRAPPRETPLTPMGLPKVKRLKKKEFSLEEIYTNKNYKSPTSNRTLETIFEEPREKDGALLRIGHQRRRRLLLFPDFTQPRKRKRPSGIGLPVASMPKKRVASRRCHGSSPVEDESDVDVMLVERLSALEDFLTQQGLDV